MITRFPRDKRKTPTEFQAEYLDRYHRTLRATLPWVLALPLVLVVGMLVWLHDVRGSVTVVQYLYGFATYAALVGGGWLLFIEFDRPRPNEGEVTRGILDSGSYWDRRNRK